MSITLTGDFVTLRPLRTDDAATTFAWRESQRAQLLNRGAATVEQQSAWIAARPKGEYNFIIELPDGHPVGMVSICDIDTTNGSCSPGRFLIGDEDAVRGIPAAVEAMALVYELIFDTLKLHRVHGIVAEHNTAMIKWQKYLGMREEGRLREHLLFDGTRYDAVMLGLLEPEYRAVALPRMKVLISAGQAAAAAGTATSLQGEHCEHAV